MGKAKGGLHKNVAGHPNCPKWREGITWVRDELKDKELEELQGMFKKCGGDKNYTNIPRKKFLTKFVENVTVDGKPLVIPDVEALFNSAQIDYDYDNFSLHEFMSLMIVLRGTDADKKLEYCLLYTSDAADE